MKKALLALTILAAAVSGAQAGLALFDDFSAYGDGGIVSNSFGAWFDNSNAARTDNSIVSSSTLRVSSSGSQDIAHFLDQTYWTNSGAVLYSRYTLKCTALPTAGGNYFSSFAGTNTYYNPANNQFMAGYRGKLVASLNNYSGVAAPQGQFWLGVISSLGSYATNGLWATPLDTNVTYTIVTKYVVGTGESTLWVSPVDETSTSVTDTTPLPYDSSGVPTNGVVNVAAYQFRQASGEGTMWIGNLKIGTSWADLTTAPFLAPTPATQYIPKNGSTPALAFQIGSPIKPASQLTLTRASSNPTLVPSDAAHIAFTQDASGTNCTVTVSAAAGEQGSAIITAGVTDGTDSSTMSFLVSVGTPSISAIANATAVTNTTVAAVPFTASDAESDALTFYVSSSNTRVLASDSTHITVSGTAPNFTVSLTPQPGELGSSKVTIYVTDTHTTNSSSFYLTMRPLVGRIYSEDFAYTSFAAPNSLYLASGGSGGPWTSVSGTAGQLQVTNGLFQATNGLAFLVGTNSEDLGASLGGSYEGSNGFVFYISFPVNFSYLPSTGGEYFFSLKQSDADTSNFRCKVFSKRAGAAAGNLRLAVANISTGNPSALARDLITNQFYYVVLRYNAASGESVLWVNPLSEQSPNAIATDSAGNSTIGGLALRQASCCMGDLAIGPIKVGTSFSDVYAAPAKEALTYTLDGSGNIVLTWSNPLFALAAADDAAGPYTIIPGAASGYSFPLASAGAKFFVLIY